MFDGIFEGTDTYLSTFCLVWSNTEQFWNRFMIFLEHLATVLFWSQHSIIPHTGWQSRHAIGDCHDIQLAKVLLQILLCPRISSGISCSYFYLEFFVFWSLYCIILNWKGSPLSFLHWPSSLKALAWAVDQNFSAQALPPASSLPYCVSSG